MKNIAVRSQAVSSFQKVRRTILFLWLIAVPVVFGWFSPVVTVIYGLQRTVNLAMTVFLAWFVSSLIFGRSFCSFACPFGAGQEAFGELLGKPLLNNRSRKRRRITRYIVFTVWLAIIFINPIINGGFTGFNPYLSESSQTGPSLVSFSGVFTTGMIMYFAIQLIAFIILTLFLGNRAGCSYGCPMSVIGDIGTRIKNLFKYPSLHLEVDPNACTQCKKCNMNCQMSIDVEEQVKKGRFDDPDCILCRTCVDTCPKHAIRYAWRWKDQ